MRKGVSEIATAALYIGISVAAITTAVTVGTPALDNMRDAAAIRKSQDLMQELDSNIDQVVSEGMGSTRTVSLEIDRGQMYFDNESNSIIYELETGADVVSPQSSRKTGNVVLSSNAEVDVYNVTGGSNTPSGYSGPDCYMLENKHVQACIKQVGGESNFQEINTSNLLTYYRYKEDDKRLNGNMTVKLDGIMNTSYGEGYTTVDRYGYFIGTGRVQAHVASEYGYSYDVIYSLPTGSDFLKVDVQNFE